MTGASGAVSETRETYDVIARAYLQRKRHRPWDSYLLDLLDRFCARLPAGARVADLGCGHGVEVAVLREKGFGARWASTSPPACWLVRPNSCQVALLKPICATCPSRTRR